jgi:hypothetical protein
MRFRALILAVLGLAAVSAQAAVSVSFQINAGLLSTNATLLVGVPDGTAIMIAAATNGTAFAPLTPGSYTSDTVWGSGGNTDVVIWTTTANGNNEFGENGYSDNTTVSLSLASFTGWSGGDPLAIYWFPGTGLGNNTISLSNGAVYGTFNNSSPGTNPNPATWVTPSSTSSGYVLAFLNSAADPGNLGSGDDIGHFGTVGTVPESATFALLGGVSALGYSLYRRRQRTA